MYINETKTRKVVVYWLYDLNKQ